MIQPLFSTHTVCRECGISQRQLYYWELLGMIRPHYEIFGSRKFRRYTSGDVEVLKQVRTFLDEGFTLQAIREKLKEEGGGKKTNKNLASSFLLPPSSQGAA